MEDLHGQHLLVTGATGPLGHAVCELALASGAKVTAASISRTMLDELRASLQQHDRLEVAEADVTNPASTEKLFDALERGTGPITSVVHAVGGFHYGALTDLPDEQFDKLVPLLFKSPLLVTRAAVRRMVPRGQGRIVLVGALAASKPTPNMALYGACKAAVAHLVGSIAAEVRASGVTINAVLPGTLDTPDNRKSMPDADPSRWVAPATIALAVATLLGPSGRGISGSLLGLPDRIT